MGLEFQASQPDCNAKPEKGEWFQMAHVLTRALYSTKELDKTQVKLLLYFVHNTWGQMGRKCFIFSLSAAHKVMGVDKSQIIKAKDALIQANIIKKNDRDGIELYVNKYPETWELNALRVIRDTETQRKKKSVEVCTTVESDDTVEVCTTEPLRYAQRSVEVCTTETRQKPAQEANPGRHLDIDNLVDIPPISPKGGRKRASEIDPRFLEAWKEYPKRTGTNSVTEAWSAFKARLEEGVSADAMLEAIPKYRKWCEAKERIGTEYVLQGASFFGPKKRGWEGDWTIPGQAPQAAKPGEVRYAQLQRRAR